MAFNPTDEQISAINAKGNILVSAAAGSGKTAVLVERVIAKLCSKTDGISADKLLIVTFTNAAAAEMRGRIEKRLDEEIRDNPNDSSILMQKHLLNSAKICTIDSFCIDLVRENFEIAGVSPDFKISDGNSLKAIDEKVIRELINNYIENKDSVFFELLDLIGAEYDEKNFIDFVQDIYNYSRQLPFPQKWFESLSVEYEKSILSSDNIWADYAFNKAESLIKGSITSMANAIDLLAVNEKAANAYILQFSEVSQMLQNLLEHVTDRAWDATFNALQEFALPKLPVVRGIADIYEVTAAKEIYKSISEKSIDGLHKIFYADSAFLDAQFEKIKAPVKLLSELLIKFDNALFEEYKAQNTFTFHNTEHLALNILCEESNGKILIKEQAKELVGRFCEVCVDEYQDTNDLQDMLFYVLSNKESNLFVVGDIKQSIYGFRGANPDNFLIKKNKYIPIEQTDETMPRKIVLGKNFRCKPEVCDFVNYFFKLFMNECTGDIIYNDEEKLIPAAEYPEITDTATEIHLINTAGSEYSSLQLEALKIVEIIKETMNAGPVIKKDKNTLREAVFSDFTILLRSARLKAPVVAEILKKQGIPVSFYVEDFAETIEISIILSLLSVVDNPQNDIDLLCVLMSPIFNFTADDIADLRIKKRDGTLYSAVIYSAENGNNKCKSVIKAFEKFRILAVTNPLPSFINILLNETSLLDLVAVLDDGARRRNNLLLLINYAEQFSTTGMVTVGGFVKYIKKQSESGIKAAGTPTGSNAVNIMSIHASKGLQFPVCIVADLNTDFNDSEAREGSIYSTEFGLGFRYFDEAEKIRYTTLSREVILDKIRADRLEEELRLLYVAMTRTQDKLILTASMSDVYKKAEKLKTLLIASNSLVDKSLFTKTKSYCDWLMLSILLHKNGKILRDGTSSVLLSDSDCKFKISIDDDFIETEAENAEFSEECDLQLAEQIMNNLSYVYPFEELLNIESKASVSRLANGAESAKYAFSYTPAFLNDGGITPAERGTAMHKVMQFFNFDKSDNIDEELLRLYEWQYISEREYNSLNIEALKAFFASDVFKRIKNSDLVKREMRFLTEVPATQVEDKLDTKFENENVIIQGAVDVCFSEIDGLVVLDFKTDRVDSTDELVNYYSEQLNIYAKACEKIFDMPVKEKIIYSFSLSKEIKF